MSGSVTRSNFSGPLRAADRSPTPSWSSTPSKMAWTTHGWAFRSAARKSAGRSTETGSSGWSARRFGSTRRTCPLALTWSSSPGPLIRRSPRSRARSSGSPGTPPDGSAVAAPSRRHDGSTAAMARTDNRGAFARRDLGLSANAQPVDRRHLSVPSQLQPVHGRGPAEVWPGPRPVEGHRPIASMPPVAPRRLRPPLNPVDGHRRDG